MLLRKRIYDELLVLGALGLHIDKKYNSFEFLGKYGLETIAKYSKIFMQSDSLTYKRTTKLSDIIDLYYFDMEIRKQIFNATELFEQTFRQAMQYVISSKISNDYLEYKSDKYLKEKYEYVNKRDHFSDVITRKNVKKRFRRVKARLNLENVTPQNMVDNLYFNQVSEWYYLLEDDIKEYVNRYIAVGILFEEVDNDTGVEGEVEKIIRLCNGFRNQAAHGGIIFDYYDPAISVTHNGIYVKGKNVMLSEKQYHCGLGILILLSGLIDNKDINQQMCNGIHYALVKYFATHDNMREKILHITGIDTLIGLHCPLITTIFDDLI